MKLVNQRYSRFYRVVCFLLAVHFLNLSVDPRDPNPDSIPEDLSFNEIESITEFVAENLIGIVNAFDEHDEDDAEDNYSVDACKFYFWNSWKVLSIESRLVHRDSKFLVFNEYIIQSLSREITSPPPKA